MDELDGRLKAHRPLQPSVGLVRRRGPTIVALWGLAIAQPLLDLFGKNPEFFVANGFSSLQIVLFGALLTFLGPTLLLAVQLVTDLVSHRIALMIHVATVTTLAIALLLTLLSQFNVDDSVIVLLVGGFGGVVLAYLERTSSPVRKGLRHLALAPLLFLVVFLGFSQSAELVRGDPIAAVEPGQVGDPAPVVFLSLDEFPVSSILRPDGTINEERFPNFALLAGQSSWYRNATSVSWQTTESVPASLTGLFPEAGALPTYQDHPRSLFTLLGSAYEQHVFEEVTEVCPPETCPDEGGGQIDRLSTALTDAAAVYGHVALPPSLQDGLPAIDRSWGGFIEDATAGDSLSHNGNPAATQDREIAMPTSTDPTCPDSDLSCGPTRISELIAQIDATGDKPGLYAGHATTPHRPWILSAQGRQYAARQYGFEGEELGGLWEDDTPTVRQAFQRHLLQVGAVDQLVGSMIDRLQSEGLWERALVVVVADHGISFTPGAHIREPDSLNQDEIYHVPMFMKAPDQVDADVQIGNALTVDILPTIADLLDIDTDWEFDGESLVGDGSHRQDKPAFYNGELVALPTDFDGVLAVCRRNATYLPHGDDWMAVAAIGSYGDLVGLPVSQLETTGSANLTWSVDQDAALANWDPAGTALVPILLDGHVELQGAAPPQEALVAVNGTISGVAVGFSADASGRADFRALIAEETLHTGANEVSLLLPTAPGSRDFSVTQLGS